MVFGRVIRGYEDVIPKIVDVPTDEKDRPKVPIVISNCGELELRKKPVTRQPQKRKHHFSNPLLSSFASAWLHGATCQSPTPEFHLKPERLATISYSFFPSFFIRF